MAEVKLRLVPWGTGTSVGAYPRVSEQMRPDGPPTMVPPSETEVVAAGCFSDVPVAVRRRLLGVRSR